MDEKYYTCIPVYVRNYLKDNCSNKFIPSNESICTSFPSCSSLYLTHIYLRMYDNVKERVNWIKWPTKLRCHFIYLVYYFSLSLFFFLSKWWHNDDHFILITCYLSIIFSQINKNCVRRQISDIIDTWKSHDPRIEKMVRKWENQTLLKCLFLTELFPGVP